MFAQLRWDYEGTEVRLMPGGTHAFRGWCEFTVADDSRDGKQATRTIRIRSFSGFKDPNGAPIIDTGESRYTLRGMTNEEADSFVQAALRARISMGDIQNLDVVLKSTRAATR